MIYGFWYNTTVNISGDNCIAVLLPEDIVWKVEIAPSLEKAAQGVKFGELRKEFSIGERRKEFSIGERRKEFSIGGRRKEFSIGELRKEL